MRCSYGKVFLICIFFTGAHVLSQSHAARSQASNKASKIGRKQAGTKSHDPVALAAACATLPLCHTGMEVFTPQISLLPDSELMTFSSLLGSSVSLDTQGVVGPEQYLVAHSRVMRTFNKQSGNPDGALDISPADFFAPVIEAGQRCSVSRVCVAYDRWAAKWVIAAISESAILIGLSTGSAPTAWTFSSFQADSDYVAVRDLTLGIDKHALYLGANVEHIPEGATSVLVGAYFVIPKRSLSSRTLDVTRLYDPYAYAPQAVNNFDSECQMGYFISTDPQQNEKLVLQAVKDPGGSPEFLDSVSIMVPAFAEPSVIPQKESDCILRGLDSRLCQSHIRNGSLFTAHVIATNNRGLLPDSSSFSEVGEPVTRNACRWYQLDLSKGTSIQMGTLFAPSLTNHLRQKHYCAPGIMTDGTGMLALACSTVGYEHSPNAVLGVRLLFDPKGTLQIPRSFTENVLSSRLEQFPWMRFSSLSIDPVDDMTMWALASWCNSSGSPDIHIVKIPARQPPMPTTIFPARVRRNTTTDIRISAEEPKGRAFYQPRPGRPYDLRVDLGQSIKIHAVNYINPTTLQATITTLRTPRGRYGITITHPDGQQVTSKDLLTVI